MAKYGTAKYGTFKYGPTPIPSNTPRRAPNWELDPDFYLEELRTAEQLDHSGRLNHITNDVYGYTTINIKTNPHYINPDTFIDNIEFK